MIVIHFSGGTNKKAASEQVNYLRSNNNSSHHHQPDLVKVSSPKLSDLARLEHVLDEKNRENDQLRIRLKHNAKGFEALALTVDHFASKVRFFLELLKGLQLFYDFSFLYSIVG